MQKAKAPPHLSKEMKSVWSRILSTYELSPDGLLVLETTLAYHDRWQIARSAIAKQGVTVKGHRGAVVAHPAVAISDAAQKLFLAGLRHLGLSVDDLEDSNATP